MIPLGDASRRPVHFPVMTALIIIVNGFVFLLEMIYGNAFINHWSFVPAHIARGQNWITLLTAMFMHAGWLHILGNMLFFWVFGPAIEDVMGPVRFLTFYLLGGIAASTAQVYILLGWFVQIAFVPAVVLIGLWFVLQLFNELGAVASVQQGGVAYMAHVGGFIFGMLVNRLFEVRRPRL
jgi:membrane associated rhomboid family serine protease